MLKIFAVGQMGTNMLELVGKLSIPPMENFEPAHRVDSILLDAIGQDAHNGIVECVKIGGVVGTINAGLMSLNDTPIQCYGWYSPVEKHTDNCGYIYFLPISQTSECFLCTNTTEMKIEVGSVYLLDDYAEHYTKGHDVTIALFLGPFSTVQDPSKVLDKFATFMRENADV